MCSVCLFDKSGAMMIEEQGQLVSLPRNSTTSRTSTEARNQTIVELPRLRRRSKCKRRGVVQLLLLVVSPHRLDLSAFNIVCN